MIGAIKFAVAAAVNRWAGAAEAGEIVRTTGERVESGFWTTLNDLLLRIPNLLGFALAILAAWFVGRLMARALRRRLERRDKPDLGRLLGAVVVGLSGSSRWPVRPHLAVPEHR